MTFGYLPNDLSFPLHLPLSYPLFSSLIRLGSVLLSLSDSMIFWLSGEKGNGVGETAGQHEAQVNSLSNPFAWIVIDPETCFRRDIDVLMRLQVEKIFEDWKKLLRHEELFLFNSKNRFRGTSQGENTGSWRFLNLKRKVKWMIRGQTNSRALKKK